MALIALLTDFGTRDEYVGVMKGVIACIDPHIGVVDICHHIEPHDVAQGAFLLAASAPFFPAGTVFAAVVDPGVGGQRSILAVECGGRRYVVPDNGLIEGVIADGAGAAIVAVRNRRYFLDSVSRTFHGRDIFAPVAARLATGLPLSELGPPVDPAAIVTGTMPRCRLVNPDCLEGEVVATDRFGNLMTNIDAAAIERLAGRSPGKEPVVTVADNPIGAIVAAYEHVARHAPLAIIGSRGLLEISIHCGNARQILAPEENPTVRVQLRSVRSGGRGG